MSNSPRIRHTLFAITGVALLAAAVPTRAAEVNASLSAREAYVGAPVTFRLEIAGASSFDEPALPDVAGLDIQSAGAPSRSTRTTIINGRRTDRSSAVYAWRLIPRREGAFVIPSISVKVDGQVQTTLPLRFVVTKSETGDLLFVEVTGQQQKIYVGQPLKLTLNVWIKPYRDGEHQLTVSADDMWRMISDATNWGAFADRISELADNNQRPGGEEVLRKDAAGAEHGYYRYRVEATTYPKRPGHVDAGGVQIVVDYPTRLAESRDPFGSMFDSGFFKSDFPFGDRGFSPFNRQTLSVAASRPVVASATVAPIEVTPIPTAGRPADYRGAVGRYQIVTHAVPASVKAGDPITLHIGVSGDGPMELVPAPPLAELPQLTADFKVTDEPLAGLVEGGAKVFTTSIRPRRAGITEIPAIPLSFFDPDTEKFVTVQSDPIAIRVAEADRLALASIVGAAPTGGNQTATPEKDTPRLDLSNDTGADAVVSVTPHGLWPLILTFVMPPLVVVSLWVTRHRQQWTAAFRETLQQRYRSALRDIDDATSPSEVATAVKDYATRKMSISARQEPSPACVLTRGEVAAHLQACGCDRAAQRVDAVLAQCEQAAYAGSGHEHLATLRTAATTLLTELSTIRPGAAAGDRLRPRNRRRALALACLLLAALVVVVPTSIAIANRHTGTAATTTKLKRDRVRSNAPANAADAAFALHQLTPIQKQTIFAEANTAYQQGLQASVTDAATAKEAFSTAGTKYQMLVDSGVRNSTLYCNLGNAYLQSGSLGRAIANYERALLLDPANAKAQTNLAAARLAVPSSRSGRDADTTSSLSHTFRTVLGRLGSFMSPVTAAMLLAAGWIALWATILGRIYLPHRRWRYALIPVACLLLIGTATAGSNHFDRSRSPQGIVATQMAILRQAPGDTFPAVTGQPLSEGEPVTVLQARGSWLRVQPPHGQTGWVASRQIERLHPSLLSRERLR